MFRLWPSFLPSLWVAAVAAASLPQRPTTVIEAAGPPGTKVFAQIAAPSNAAALWLRTENLVDPNQASLIVDGAAAIPLNNSMCRPLGLASNLNGIGGPLTVITFAVPAAAIRPGGSNTLTFVINSTPQNAVSAFRVLEVNFIDTSGNLILPPQIPVAAPDAPNNYLPSDVAAGSNWWFSAPLISAWGGPPISAHCSDCHAIDGSDLVYFGYSDSTIEQRSAMHGLAPGQCAQVLAYIRSLSTVTYGAPWNPPFQPGTNIDNIPANQWAAGAGINAVATNDSQTFSFLFGTNAPSFSFAKTINVRTLPVAMPLPTWDDWLPAVFPMDYYGGDFSNVWYYYNLLRQATSPADFQARMGGFASAWSDFVDNTLDNHYVSNNQGDQMAWYSACRWRNVKIWEILHLNGWEAQGALFDPWPLAASRLWPDNGVFHTAPHFSIRSQTNHAVRDGTELTWNYMSAQWYWVQLTLNDSQHRRGGASPIDWPYLLLFSGSPMAYNVPSAAQTLVGLTKAAESGTGDPYCAFGDDSFLPWRAARTEFLMDREYPAAWQGYDLNWRNSLFNAWLTEWSNWIYTLGRGYFITNSFTMEIVEGDTNNAPVPAESGSWIGEHASFLQWLEANNSDIPTVKMMVDLANYLWPAADWSAYAGFTNAAMAGSGGGVYSPTNQPASTIHELAGTVGSATVLTVHTPHNAVKLWLRTENLKDGNQVTLQVDSGPIIPLNNANIAPVGLAAQLNGIGGPLSVLSFTVPAARLTPSGTNQLTFTINSIPLNSVATMRILDVNFTDANGNLTMASHPYYGTPLTGYNGLATDIAAGSNLWRQASLKSTWGGTNTTAHCASCHAADGSDLAYFGSSDRAIATHVSKHGLKAAQGAQILSYIRSLPTPPYGRTWNPPYQPGPGMDELPAAQWAAGAGLGAVLTNDTQTFAAWFGSNTPSFNFSQSLNIRELPVAMPLPTWNDWLPNIFPGEYYGSDFAPVMNSYSNFYTAPTPASFTADVYDFISKMNTFACGSLNNHYNPANPTDNLAWFSACRWANVKIWEVIHARGWEGQGASMMSFLNSTNIAARIFPGSSVYQTTPSLSFRSQSNFGWRDGSTYSYWYGSAQWQWLQLVLDDSQHHRWGDTPINWQTMTSAAAIPLSFGIPSTAQVIAAVTKAAESGTGDPFTGSDSFQAFRSCSTERIMMRGHNNAWTPYNPVWRNQLIDAWLGEWNRWVTGLGRNYFINVTGEVAIGETNNNPAPPEAGPWIGEHAAFLQWLAQNGADPSTYSMMLNLAQYLWPAANWSGY